MKTWPSSIKFLALCLMLSACTSKKNNGDYTMTLKSTPGEPLTKVGSITFSVEELRQDFAERQGTFKGNPNLNSDKARSDYLENQVTQEAMFQEAVSLGYLDKSDVKRDLKKVVVQKYMRDMLEKSQTDFAPTEEMMKEHYEKNQNLYNRGEEVKVAYISIPFGDNQAGAKKAATLLHKQALTTVKKGSQTMFSKVPMNNKDALSEMGVATVETNETDFMGQDEFDKKFGAGSFESIKKTGEVGQVGSLASVNNYYIIIMKTGYRKALNETMEQAKDKIVKRLSYENRGEYYKKMLEDLKKKYNTKIYEDKIALLSKGIEDPTAAFKGMPPAANKPEASAKDQLKEEPVKEKVHN